MAMRRTSALAVTLIAAAGIGAQHAPAAASAELPAPCILEALLDYSDCYAGASSYPQRVLCDLIFDVNLWTCWESL